MGDADTVSCAAGEVALGGGVLPSGAGKTAALVVSAPAFGNGNTPSGWSFAFNNAAPDAKATL